MSEVERLRDRVEELEGILGLNLKLPNEFGLSHFEMKILGVIVRHEIISRDAIFTAVYGGRSERDQPDIKTIEVHLVKIRRKIAAKGHAIKNYFGVGYYLEGDSRAALKSLCDQRVAA